MPSGGDVNTCKCNCVARASVGLAITRPKTARKVLNFTVSSRVVSRSTGAVGIAGPRLVRNPTVFGPTYNLFDRYLDHNCFFNCTLPFNAIGRCVGIDSAIRGRHHLGSWFEASTCRMRFSVCRLRRPQLRMILRRKLTLRQN